MEINGLGVIVWIWYTYIGLPPIRRDLRSNPAFRKAIWWVSSRKIYEWEFSLNRHNLSFLFRFWLFMKFVNESKSSCKKFDISPVGATNTLGRTYWTHLRRKPHLRRCSSHSASEGLQWQLCCHLSIASSRHKYCQLNSGE